MGKILVIEGTDCSGKTTQYEKLCERLKSENIKFATDSFPDYESDSSHFVREYLAGKFGEKPSDVSGRTASVFYGVDRYSSYMTKEWGRVYREGGNVLFARYITANLLHQACKLKTEEEKEKFIDWLYDFEVGTMGIPKEDNVILLKMPFELVKELKSIPKTLGTIEIEVLPMFSAMNDKAFDKPINPAMCMITEAKSGMVLAAEFSTPKASALIQLTNTFINTVFKRGLPRKIYVCNGIVATCLDDICRILNIKLELKPFLPAINEAMNSFRRFMR